MIFNTDYNQQAALELVAQCTGLKPADIIGKGRYHDHVLARQCLATVYRNHMGIPLTRIGAILGPIGSPRDHTTVIHSIRRFSELLDVRDEKATELWDMVISRLDSVVDSGCRVMVRAQNKDLQKLLTMLEKAGFYYETV
jgi:hypothetical protein